MLGSGEGRDFRFTSPEGQQTWLREAYRQAVNADTWHLGDKVDDQVRDAILAGVGGAQPPMFRGPDRQYYLQNARTMEDATTRSHRARHLAGKTMDQIAATGMPGEDEYVALRGAQSATAMEAARLAYAANDNVSVIDRASTAAASPTNENRSAEVPGEDALAKTIPAKTAAPPTKIPGTGMAFLPRIPIDSPSAKIVVDKEIADAVDDYIRLGLNGLTGNTADELGASLDAFFASLAGEDFDVALAARLKHYREMTDAARERRGIAGTVVETLPGFIPIVGDISGLVADFKDYLENGDQWTAEDWALVAAGMIPGAPNRKTVKAGKKIVDDLLQPKGSQSDLLAQIEHSKANVLTVSEANRLGGEHKGLIHIAETPPTNKRARDHQFGTDGAFSDVRTQKFGSAALRYVNPNKRGRNFIKFEVSGVSPDGKYIELVDAKTKLAIWSRGAQETTAATLRRVKSALDQNPGYRVVYEFADEMLADEAREFIQRFGFKNYVTVRVRAQ